MDNYIAFNKALKTFLRETSYAFPHIKEIKLSIALYKMLKTINKKRPCRFFTSVVEKCQEPILSKDEEFFYKTDIECPEPLKGLFAVVQREWFSLSPEQKDVFWRHLILLVLLSRKCNSNSTY